MAVVGEAEEDIAGLKARARALQASDEKTREMMNVMRMEELAHFF